MEGRNIKTPLPASTSEVQEEVRAIRSSQAFAHSHRHAKLLEYLCNKVLLGQQDEIKESTIALEIFGRTWEFDEKKDAIVRVEAHRLRKRLAKYYETEGSRDRVVVELSPGGYIPEFTVRGPQLISLEPVPSHEPTVTDSVSTPARNGFKAPSKLVVAILVALTILLAGALAISRLDWPRKATGRAADSLRHPPLLVPPSGEGVRILAGSRKPYIDRAGRHWLPDQYFKGGTSEPGPTDFMGKPPDPTLYRSMRLGEFSYDIPALRGVYELRLYFAEPTFRSGNDVGGEGGENERHFTVTLNGAQLLRDFDVVSDTGTAPVDVRAFRDISPAEDGYIHLRFEQVRGAPFVNAIELIPGTRGRTLPIRIRAYVTSFTDHAGNVWSPDDYYVGGRLSTHKHVVTGTADPDLYSSERYGNFSYAIPVPPGRYCLTLHFAETFWNPQAATLWKDGIGARIFNVSCNNVSLMSDFDLLKETKPDHAVVRTFHNLQPNGQGKLLVSFSPVRNYATVKAIEVVDEGAAQ